MSRKNHKKHGWFILVVIVFVLFSSCNQTQSIVNDDSASSVESASEDSSIIGSVDSSSSIESSHEDSSAEDSANEEYTSFVFPRPFDDSAAIEEYRIVANNSAVAPDGIYIIDPKYNLHFVSGAKSEKLAEDVSGIVGITSEWLYCTISSNPRVYYEPVLNTLVRISLTDSNTEKLLDNISCAIYNPAIDRVYYCKISDPIELYALDLTTGQHTLIFTDEGVLTEPNYENVLKYAYTGWFDSQSDGTFALGWAYPYPSEIPYVRYQKIDGYEIVCDSESAPWEVEYLSDMKQNKMYHDKRRMETKLTQIRYGIDKKLMTEDTNGVGSHTLYYEQNGEREQVIQSAYWIYDFAYCYDRVYYLGYEIRLGIYDLVSKKSTISSLNNVRALFAVNDKLYAYLAIEDENYYNTYQLVEMNQDAEIIQTIYEKKGNFVEGLGAQSVRSVQIDDYILLLTDFWAEDVLSFCWVYNTKTGESISIEM